VTAVNRLAALAVLLAAAPAPAQDSRFARADTDRNGTLSRAEVEHGLPKLAPRFNEIDRNRDGNLSPDELRSWSQTRKPEAAKGGFAEHFHRADSDGDGGLTRPEADKALPRLGAKFDRIDTNHDGKLTPDELRRYFDAQRLARGKPPGA
jgi:hypothetical protein